PQPPQIYTLSLHDALPILPSEIKKPFELISTDLAKRSKLPASSFQISGYDMQTFPTSALGCPDPGLDYLQVLTPGYIIRVEAGGDRKGRRLNSRHDRESYD